ncbi:MAG: FHA domain-containing protein [Halanaeroarchaeum sp.]
MRTPAVYDLQTEKLAYPEGEVFSLGTDADVAAPVAEPWGNRGGVDNIARLLEGVEKRHATIAVEGDVASVDPDRPTSTIYVESKPIEGETTIRNGETIVLGSEKSDLWEGYRVQVFF